VSFFLVFLYVFSDGASDGFVDGCAALFCGFCVEFLFPFLGDEYFYFFITVFDHAALSPEFFG